LQPTRVADMHMTTGYTSILITRIGTQILCRLSRPVKVGPPAARSGSRR
jgi:hypothetical protein